MQKAWLKKNGIAAPAAGNKKEFGMNKARRLLLPHLGGHLTPTWCTGGGGGGGRWRRNGGGGWQKLHQRHRVLHG
jgi:hypothetical protein